MWGVNGAESAGAVRGAAIIFGKPRLELIIGIGVAAFERGCSMVRNRDVLGQ